jgi:hypothetical protein
MNTDAVSALWIDESGRPSPNGYVYAVAGVRPALRSTRSDRVADLLLPSQRYLHWRDEPSGRRREIVAVINELRLDVHVAYAVGIRPRQQEAARSACLSSVVSEAAIHAVGLAGVNIEGRGRDLDIRDEYAIRNVSRRVLPHAPPTVVFVATTASPLLWVADAVASIASAYFAESGGSDFWWRSLRSYRLTLREVEA